MLYSPLEADIVPLDSSVVEMVLVVVDVQQPDFYGAVPATLQEFPFSHMVPP